MQPTDHEQLKWFLLDQGVHRHPLAHAEGFARMLFPEKARPEIEDLVRGAILELHEEGLIFLFRSDYDEAWQADESTVQPLDRTEVVALLDADDWEEDRFGFPFFDGTERGLEVLQGLPARAAPVVAGEVPPWPDATPP